MSRFKALMTAIYPAPDVQKARAWYAQAFGVQPSFDEPFYVGFDVGGFELGLVPSEGELHQPGNRGVVAYWGTDDAQATFDALVAAGAKPLDPIKDVGGGIRVGVLADPFGNALGIIENPHFKR